MNVLIIGGLMPYFKFQSEMSFKVVVQWIISLRRLGMGFNLIKRTYRKNANNNEK